jgi:site-specific DNA-methyltransferase (adenine-specific)
MTEFLPPSPCWILWDKGFSEDVTFAQFEMAWTSFKSSAKKFDKSPNNPNRIHPTEKPIALYKWLLHNYAKQGDKILDTHLGSGSIAIACHQMGFDLTGSELDKDYFEAMQKRIKEETAQKDLFEGLR